MLRITIPASEYYDEGKGEFVTIKEQSLQLEHSLVSLSKWESKWQKPFFSSKDITIEQTLDYVRCMTLTQNVRPEVYGSIPSDVLNEIYAYIEKPMTATTIREDRKTAKREIITAEILYYDMIVLGIPFECQKWHLNRLLTLINVCAIKNKPQKKMSRSQILAQNRALNASRRKKHNTKG